MNAPRPVSRARLFGAALALLLVLPLLAWAGSLTAHAAPLPDLKVTALSTSAQTVAAGSTVSADVTVKNAGRKKAGRSLTRFYLSRDDSWSRTDVLLGKTKVAALPAGDVSRKSVQLTVPGTVTAQRYFVVACADAKAAVKESREGNNCRATDAKVEVTDGAGMFPFEPDPLGVDSTLQTDRARTMTAFAWDADGATEISATAEDGTKYTLEVPYRALWTAQDITMTPVASVPGLPLSGGLVAGVQIEPHGLLLQEPATLTIESPDAGALANQTGFLFHEDGDDFHLYPMDAPKAGDDKDVIRMTLTHFSTPGVASGSAADRSSVQNRPPVRNQSQMQQAVSDLLSGERASQLQGNPPDDGVGQQVKAIHDAYFDDVVRSQMQAAETNADLGPEAIAEGLGWSRARSLMGDEDNPRIKEVLERVEKILKNMMNKYWTRCTVQHEVAAAAWLVGIARQAALWGFAWQAEAADKAERCGNFEMRFDSMISGHHDQPGDNQSHQSDWLYHVRSVVEVPWVGFAYGVIDYTDFRFYSRVDYANEGTSDPCVQPNHYTETVGTGTTPGSVFASARTVVNPEEHSGSGTPPATVAIRLHVGMSATGPASPTEDYHTDSWNCSSSSYDRTESGWEDAFARLHANTGALEYEVPAGSGEVVFTEEWSRTIPDSWGERREETVLELRHKPLP